jgi:hypothetical protein
MKISIKSAMKKFKGTKKILFCLDLECLPLGTVVTTVDNITVCMDLGQHLDVEKVTSFLTPTIIFFLVDRLGESSFFSFFVK